MKKNIFYTLCLLFLVGNLYSQQTVWVKVGATGTADGSSEANAFTTIGAGLLQIDSAGDILRVVGTVPASGIALTTTTAGVSLNKNFAYTIEGDAGGSTLTGTAGATRMFTINSTSVGHNVTFKNIKFTGATGSTGAGGGVLLCNQPATVKFENCIFDGNTLASSVTAGGGALNFTGTAAGMIVTITDCTFKNNTSPNIGGAIFSTHANLTITKTTFYNNKTLGTVGTVWGGAALYVGAGTSSVNSLTNCTFYQNTSTFPVSVNQDFGIIRTEAGNTTVTNCLFYDNKAAVGNPITSSSPSDWGCSATGTQTFNRSIGQWISNNVDNRTNFISSVKSSVNPAEVAANLTSSNLTWEDASNKVKFSVAPAGAHTPIAFGSDGKDVGAWDCGTRVAPTFDQVAAICSGATLSALPTTSTNGITGTWSPALNNTATTEYTFTPALGQCASSTATMTITVNPNTTIPTFTQVASICSGSSLSALPTTSDNSITGTWSPALNNTATTEYTFTPTAGICASTATMTITVNPLTTDGSVTVAEPTGSYTWALNSQTYNATGTYTYVTGCNTATLNLTTNVSSSEPTITSLTSDGTTAITQGCAGTTLVITGTNFVGVTAVTVNGVAVASYVVNSATQITATLPAGAIVSGAVVVTTTLGGASTTGGNFAVNANVTPSFTAVSAICSGGSLSALPTTSDNSITGTWSPALNNAATTAYTFTPTAGQCATTAAMTITVNSNVTPTFTAVSAICSGASLSALPTTSNNSVTGIWSPAINNTATTEYTFTPTEGLCATTATMTITVNACPDTFTWNGSSSSDWATAANWTKTTGTGPDGFPGQTPGRSIDNVVISNGGTPVIASGTYVIYSLAINNTTGVDTGSILTIDSGATLTVNNTSATLAAVAITLKGGSIVNNGTLNATATNTGASFGIACLVPSVAPSSAKEYGYSGFGALNITTTLGNASSGGIQFNGTSVNTTYKMLFNGTTTFSLNNTALAVYALRVVDGAKNPIIIGGAGFTLGTVGAPVNNGLLIMGNNGNNVTVNTGTTLTLNSAATNTAMGINILQTAAASADVNFTNKGTISILGASSSSVINLSVNNSGNTLPAINKINFENQGTLNVDVAIGSSSNNAALRVPATTGQGLVTITNTGTGVLNLKNSQPFTSVTGCPIRIFAATGTPAVTINNAGALTLTGQSVNFGGLASRSSINNTGTIVSSSEFQAFAVTNGTAGTITFDYNTPATSRSVQFTVGLTAAAAAGATYTDANSNVYTVVFAKVNGTGTGLTGGFALTGTTPATGTLTKTSGTGDASIAYSAITLYEATYLSASDSAFTNNGTVYTGTATNLNTFAALTTSATSVIVPGGTPGVGNTDIANASTVALNGTLKLDIQSIASSTSYDKITNSATGGGFNISNATLDLTGIFTPLGNRNINIVTTNATGTLTGNFASVIGLESKPRWSINYITGTNGKVQLIYVAQPTVTSLTSDGTIAITEGCAGSTLVIKGTDLTGATAVTVNGVAVASFVVTDSTTITAILPASSTGAGVVAVTTPGGTGTSAGNFAVIATTPSFTQVAAICSGGSLSDLPTTSNNSITGTWSPALNNAATTEYTFTPTAGQCAATGTMTITVNPIPAAPTASSQTFCNSGTVTNLVATGTALNWYSAEIGGSALASDVALVSGNYYASQTLNSCESSRTLVSVIRNNTAAPATESQTFCSTNNSLTVANLSASGTDLKWYDAPTGGNLLASSDALSTRTYYVSQTLNSCESERTPVSVTVNVTSSPAVESQVFCSSANATVASLVASGDSLVWYSAATDGSVLASDTALVSGNYYVTQTQNSCESSRSEVAVTLTNSIATQPTDTNICTTLGSLASISVVATPGTTPTYAWYVSTTLVPAWTAITAANAGTTALPIYTNYNTATLNIKKQLLLVAGNKYRVVVTGGYCGTVTSNEVTLNVNALATVKAITGAVATCSGDAKTLTLATGSVGTIQWQSSTTSASTGFNPVVGGTITTSPTNLSTYATPALTESIWYRVASTNGACPVVNSAAVALAVTQPAVISAITGGDNTVCCYTAATATAVAVQNSTALSVSTSAGTILWQKSVNYVNTTNVPAVWAAAGSTSSDFTATNLIATTWYRAQITNGACIKYSNVVKITVTPKAVAGTITTNTTSVCLGGDITFTLTGKVGTIQWQTLTSATNFASAVNVGDGGITYTVTAASVGSLFVRAVVSSELCSTATTAVKTIVVNPTSNGGTASGGGVVCSGSPGTLSVAGNVGKIQWQSSSDGVTFVNVPTGLTTAGATYASGSATGIAAKYLVTNITADTWFRAKIKSGICSEAYSNVVQYTIGTEAVAGTIAASASTICAASGTTLTLSNSIGAITWKKSTNWTAATPTWTAVASSATTPITNNGTTLGTGNLAATTAYQASVTIGACSSPLSNIQIVTVNPAAKGGVVAVSVSGTNICSGGSKTMKVTGNVGTIQWQRSTTSATEGFENVAGATTATYEFLNITAPTWFKVVASSGVCTVTNASNAVQITVTTTPAVQGVISGTNSICTANPTSLTLSDSSGTIAWQKATYVNGVTGTFATIVPSTTITVTGTNGSVLNTGNLTASTTYRAVVTSGSCVDTTPAYVVTVSPAAKATAITGFNTATTQACIGTPTTLTLSTGYSGSIEWLSCSTLAGTYNPITNATGTTYVYTPTSTATMYFKVRLTSSPCLLTATSATGVAVFAKQCPTTVVNNNPATVSKTIVAPFDVKAYPNPYASAFQLDFTTSSDSQVEMRVYDMIGKLVEARQFNTAEMNNQEVGNNYPSGIYNVIVTQGENMKTLRVIKR